MLAHTRRSDQWRVSCDRGDGCHLVAHLVMGDRLFFHHYSKIRKHMNRKVISQYIGDFTDDSLRLDYCQ